MNKLIIALYSLTIVSCSKDKAEPDLTADNYICQTLPPANQIQIVTLD
jgi:hypothetical protein